MELLKGNLLLLLTIVSSIAFVAAYAQLCDSPFRMVFEFCRRKNMQYECKIAGLLMLCVSVVCATLYQLFCMLFHYKGVSFLSVVFVLLTLLTFYLLLSNAVLKSGLSVMIVIFSSIFIFDILIFLFIAGPGICFDQYYGYGTLILGLLDILLFFKWLHYWKKGDVF